MFQPSVNTLTEGYGDEQSHPFDAAFSEYENHPTFIDEDGGMLDESQ